MNLTDINSDINTERTAHQQAVKRSLILSRRKRVHATDEESLEVIESLAAQFTGRELATALAAEGFGTAREVRSAAFLLSGARA